MIRDQDRYDVFRGNILLGSAPGIIDRQEIERVVLPEDGPKGRDVFILQEARRAEPVRLVYGDNAFGKAPAALTAAAIFAGLWAKSSTTCTSLFCLGHEKRRATPS